MRILFMGTPDFAAVILRMSAEAGLDIVGAVSQPDKPKGRGHKLAPTEVKTEAQKYGISVYQPETLKDGAAADLLDELKPELIVVAAYGKILPEYILNYPKYGCINVHASLLPKYRGAAPIQRAIIEGETETGVTIMRMAKGLDTGDMLSSVKTPIGEYETAEELFDRLAALGGELLVKTVGDIEAGNVTAVKQDDEKATYAHMISREDGKIDWSKTTREIINLIRGLNSWPLAYTMYKGEILKIVSAISADAAAENANAQETANAQEAADAAAGTITALEKGKGMKVLTGDGALYVKTAQFYGSRKMDVEDYARGHEVEIGTVLGG
ncbi:MAG: methionyl-tRNA formyltransferase [Firmicutes bacterium]|nr:methionyl-tRNA formyltransferase [Bacillota bacterium]